MPDKKMQLFLVPFAGGSITAFKNLMERINRSVDVIPIEFAGRGKRRHEPFFDTYDDFLQDVKSSILRQRKEELDYSILGYSMGGNIVYDLVTDGLLDDKPKHTFICARDSVNRMVPSLNYYKLSNEAFIEKMRVLGGIDKKILESPRFLPIYLKPIRKDYRILGQFRYRDDNRKIPSDLTVIYSEKDTPYDSVVDWAKLADGAVDFFQLGENNFFIKYEYSEMARIINEHLEKYL